MTVFFDIAKIESYAKGDSSKFIKLFKDVVTRRIPKKSSDPNPLKYIGSSYILNPKALLDYRGESAYVVQYIKLAARRDYFMYTQYRVSYLDLSYYPDILLQNIIHNPLIEIKEGKIFFKYER